MANPGVWFLLIVLVAVAGWLLIGFLRPDNDAPRHARKTPVALDGEDPAQEVPLRTDPASQKHVG
jgi:hypothetical protein